ncbi:hypothetical protein BHAOGJBA_2965 [Methylobacterium hispanicum]|uniref:RDD domain-containing protein n=1 Tax=Methylobacterium hispanicum TaxID=270350 RepID=A0AAV4ZMB1_9HYPH|nr:RDD family protein [Methylobacterium hispanicum]GJD89438.1 hypothetical protein BHAOGJBA_2965 [Methylobacterium hispanicum]
MSRSTDFDDRVAAAFVDALAIFGIVGASSFGLAVLDPHPRLLQWGCEAAAYVLSCLLLPPLCEARWGATPGKLLCGLRVVDAGGRPPRFGNAVLRNLLKYGIAPILILQVSAGRIGGHDRIGGTHVVRSQARLAA